jgi:lipopolysaccharide biosynthesis glycosyltransferase
VNETPIVFGVDDRYVVGLGVALRSLVAHNRDHLAEMEVIVLHEDLSPEAIRRVRCHGEELGDRLRLLRCHLPDRGYDVSRGATRANYLRLFMDRVLPDRDRVLYLDSDVLVLGDLAPLLATDLGELPLAAVRDPTQGVYRYGNALPGWRELGIPPDREYFNSGVMLARLEQCRRAGLFERALRFMEERPDCIVWWDQDALNWAVDDRWLRLDRTWNAAPMSALIGEQSCGYGMEEVVPLRTLLDEELRARILHYMSWLKPWNPQFPIGPARIRYARFLLEAQAAERRAAGG